MSMSLGGAAAAGILIWQEKKVIEKLKNAKAFSPETAIEPEQADIKSQADRSALHRLVRKRKVYETGYKRYYVVEQVGNHH